MNIFDKNFKDIFFSQLVSLGGGLIAGLMLAIYADKLFLIPGMLILLPGFLEMRGNISGSFASRLSSGLFLGIIKPNKIKTKIIKGNLSASFFLVLFVSFLLGFLAFLFNYFFLKTVTIELIFMPLVAGIIANVIEIPLTLFVTFYLFKKGHDPNNIMGPFITSTGDITSIVSLLIAMVIV
ncbi:magnesium transporter [Candidatus Woesearchaeota archaeon]|nr:magnesium transporter [Candidatus Woesearchaeota archaeon]